MRGLWQQIESGAAWVWGRLWNGLLAPLDDASRFHWPDLLVFALLGCASVYWYRDRKLSLIGLLSRVFPKRVYAHPSAVLDYQIYFAHLLLQPLYLALRYPAEVFMISATSGWLMDTFGGRDASAVSTSHYVVFGVLLFVVRDFAAFVWHFTAHKTPLLWPFHKLHHSAEVLTPITLYREHPVYHSLNVLLKAVTMGPTIGLIGYLCVGRIDPLTSLVFVTGFDLFAFLGSHLRHSHLWLSYGPHLSRLFISPAQHQIHHSAELRHRDKNFGVTLAIWDGLFGSLYVPDERETFEFGVGDGRPQPHATLVRAYAVPFADAARVVAGSSEPAPAGETPKRRARRSRRPRAPRRRRPATRRARG